MLIINADDWGRSPEETDAALVCYHAGRVSSVSAMVFMEDSERAAAVAMAEGIPVGLHLNLCEPMSRAATPEHVFALQAAVARFLNRSRFALLFYHPGLRRAFHETYNAQVDEFRRLYGRPPTHVDGHRHRHLATNMLLDGVIPRNTKIRRGFYFWPGEKSYFNRAYRTAIDKWLTKRYRTTDFFFALSQCLDESRLGKVLQLANTYQVELMVHPVKDSERSRLLEPTFGKQTAQITTGSYQQV